MTPAASGRQLTTIVVGEGGPDGRRALESIGRVTLVDARRADLTVLEAVEAAFVWDFRSRSLESLLPELPNLRWIHTASAGVDHIVGPGVRDAGIAVSNSAGIFDRPIAEYVLGLVFIHAKSFARTIEAQRERRWAYRATTDVSGRTMAVVGLGRIGRVVAELAQAVGINVIGVRSSGAGVSNVEVVPADRLGEALGAADYVVVTAALTPATRGLIGRSAIEAMKPSAYLINVARGAIVDTDALVEALSRGRIAGAALDVFVDEPLPASSPLWTTPGLLISPHMAGDTHGWDVRVAELFAANVDRYLAGEPLINEVDQARGY
jgi:phosphoglycerate dehydrogenase-like enzyme